MEIESNVSIHETSKKAEFADDIELIAVPLSSRPIVLLRSKKIPEFAFVLWVERKSTTLSQLVFRTKGSSKLRYPLVCACCPSETYGLEALLKAMPKWEKQVGKVFKDALVAGCRTAGIRTIFMRNAEAWDKHYGKVKGLSVVEGQEHHQALCQVYDSKIVDSALRFIDRERSSGLEPRS